MKTKGSETDAFRAGDAASTDAHGLLASAWKVQLWTHAATTGPAQRFGLVVVHAGTQAAGSNITETATVLADFWPRG